MYKRAADDTDDEDNGVDVRNDVIYVSRVVGNGLDFMHGPANLSFSDCMCSALRIPVGNVIR